MWSIAEVCERTGLSPRTIRYYEEIGLLPDVRRRAGGRRIYDADALERLGFIGRLKALGLSLAEIRELNAVHAIGGSTRAMLMRLRDLLQRKQAEVDRRIDELADLRRELVRYRSHVEERLAAAGSRSPAEPTSASPETSAASPLSMAGPGASERVLGRKNG